MQICRLFTTVHAESQQQNHSNMDDRQSPAPEDPRSTERESDVRRRTAHLPEEQQEREIREFHRRGGQRDFDPWRVPDVDPDVG